MIGYKVAAYKDDNVWKPCLITLEIPEDAKIVTPIISDSDPLSISKYGNKLRCDKCRVCSIVDLETGKTVNHGYSIHILSLIIHDLTYYRIRKSLTPTQIWLARYAFIYKVSNEYDVYPDSLDKDVTRECTRGIHFFTTEEDAKNFYNEESPSGNGSWASQVIYKANVYRYELATPFHRNSIY